MASTTFTTRALTAALFTLLAWAATPLTTQAQLPDYLPTEGLVGWWPFNGNANDESGNGNNGTINGATLTTDRFGQSDMAYSFNGNNNYMSIPSFNWYLNNGFTFSFWVNLNDLNTDQLFIKHGTAYGGSGDGVYMNLFTSRVYITSPNNQAEGAVTPQFPFTPETWVMITYCVQVNNFTNIYLNGNLISTPAYNGIITNIIPPSTSMYFGKDVLTNSQSLNGKLDDIAIYNRALTPEEITALYTGIPYVAPCADPTACNFEQEGECVYAEAILDCAGNCLNDCNNNGICDEDEVFGCKYPTACNYNPEATSDDDSCTFPAPNYDCDGNCLLDLNNNGLCDLEEAAGCTNVDAINYNAEATLDDGSCMVTCKGDFDNDGQITINDLLGFLAAYGNQCEGAGCMDPAGCNYDPNATFDLGYCEYPAEFFNCDGTPVNDTDGDGIPDELEVAGCTNPEAGNYNPDATDDNGSCTFGLTGATHTCGAENVHNPDLVYGSVTDIDGNTYRTIVIGNQEWMAEDLKVAHYANGDPIPQITQTSIWTNLQYGAWCYNENDVTYECPYGKIYNRYVTIDERNVCPIGWHVPFFEEWNVLTDFLGGPMDAGGKMKSSGSEYWQSAPDWQSENVASNESGFSGLSSPSREPSGAFANGNGLVGGWWSATEDFPNGVISIQLLNFDTYVQYGLESYRAGFSIRCLKD